MGRIPEETIEAIRNRTDIVDLIGRYVVAPADRPQLQGPLPVPQEKTPSFNVNPERQIFHCFGCGEGGNAFAFLMKHENLTLPRSGALARRRSCGIEIPETESERRRGRAPAPPARGDRGRPEPLPRRSSSGPPARSRATYLAKRGIDAPPPSASASATRPTRWDALARALGASAHPRRARPSAPACSASARAAATTTACAVALTFPIQDVRGDVIGFGGRALDARTRSRST